MKRVLLTGGTGLIGRHAVDALLERGYEVHATVRVPNSLAPRPNLYEVPLDLLDHAKTARAVAAVKATHLLHLAWYTPHRLFWTAPANLDWIAASLNLVKAFAENSGQRLVCAGTCAEYSWAGREPLDERSTVLEPGTLYGRAKLSLWQVIEKYTQHVGVNAAWGRVFFLHGPGEHPDRLVPSVVRSLARGERASVRASTHVRDLLHAEDVARALAATLESPVSGAINIGSGQATTLGDVARDIARLLGRMELLDLQQSPDTPENPAVLLANVDRLTREVGFTPQYSLEAGLAMAVAESVS